MVVYPVILTAAFILFNLCTKGFIYDVFYAFITALTSSHGTGAAHRSRLFGIIAGAILFVIIWGGTKLWNLRRVIVYNDRIEVKYLLRRNWNYQIMIKDIDCCCAEIVEVETKDNFHQYNRFYLLTGRKLWLYISESESSNFDEMLSVLTEHFGIPIRNGSINLSSTDMEIVKHGDYISLDDISAEELTAMSMQRQQRSLPRADFDIPRSTKMKYFLIEYGAVLLVAIFSIAISTIQLVSQVFKENNTVTLSCLDANTEIPPKLYYTIDSIDVDSCGILCASSHRMRTPKENTRYKITTWAFPVKGQKNVWVAVTLKDYEDVLSPIFYIDNYCMKILHQKHTYKKVTDATIYKDVIKKIAEVAKVRIDDNFLLLVMADEKPVDTGRSLYCYALNHGSEVETAFGLMKQAAEEFAAAQYELGLMYEYGKGVDADSDEALRMYKLAARQNYDTKTKIDAMNQMSYVYAGRREYNKAIAIIDSAIAVAPQEANLYDSKGEHLYKYGEPEEAEKMWKRVIELEPQFREKYNSELYRLLYEK